MHPHLFCLACGTRGAEERCPVCKAPRTEARWRPLRVERWASIKGAAVLSFFGLFFGWIVLTTVVSAFERPPAGLGSWFAASLFAGLAGGGAWFFTSRAIDLWVNAVGSHWEISVPNAGVVGAVTALFGRVVAGGTRHFEVVRTARPAGVTSADLEAAGPGRVAASGRSPVASADELAFWAAFAGLASTGGAAVHGAFVRGWGKAGVFRRRTRAEAVYTLLFERGAGAEAAPMPELERRFAAALGVLEQMCPGKTLFELADVLFQLPASAPGPAPAPASEGPGARDVADRLARFHDDVRGASVLISAISEQAAPALDVALRLAGHGGLERVLAG
jgi:hypothetical protein